MSPAHDVPEGDQATALIAAIATAHDKGAFALLFAQFAPTIMAYLRRSGCEAAEAEELTQEAMLAVWRKAHQFDPNRATAAAWIFAIARNLRVDGLRRFHAGLTDEIEPEPSPLPDQNMVDRQALARLHAALSNLPPEQMEVIGAAYIDHRPHAEIAERLGLPLGTVKSRLRLALRRLRSEMEAPE